MGKEFYTVGTGVRITDSLEIADPDSVTVTIKNPSGGVVVNAVAMTMEAAGKYYYIYQSNAADPLGEYVAITSVTKGINSSVVRNTFTLQAQ